MRAWLNRSALSAVCAADSGQPAWVKLEISMLAFAKSLVLARPRAFWLLVVILPLVVAACNNSGSGSGY